MVDDKFSRPEDKRPGDATEGVRIIGAEEAAEALERGDVASRRGGDAPRYGDRPKPPPIGPRPALRFPLDATADPTAIEKPAVRPSGSAAIEFEPLSGVESGGGQRFDPLPPAGYPAEEATSAYEVAEPPPEPEPTIEPDAPTGPIAEGADDVDEPAEPLAPVEMPHWSDPPTGEVPRVIVGEEGDDLDAWSSFAASSPRWRDSDRDWESEGAVHEMLGTDAEWRVGAMDDTRPTDDEIYSFENLEHEVSSPVIDLGPEPDLEFHDDDPYEDEPSEHQPIAIGRRGAAARTAAPRRTNPVADYAAGGSGYAPPTGGAGRNLGIAVGVGVVLALVAIVLFKLGSKFTMALVVVVLVMAAAEFFTVVRRAGYQPAVLFGIVATAACPLAVYYRQVAAYPVLIAVIVIAAMCWHLVGADGDARVVESIGITLFGVAWIGGLGSFAVFMLAIPGGGGPDFLWAAVLPAVAYDVGGLFVGRSAGSRPLSEASPNKTIEGLVGGIVAAVFIGTFIVGLKARPFNHFGDAFVLALAAAIAAPLGDLCESLVKRDLGIKDMGSILPEHGGILDRFDGMLFVLPAVFFAAAVFHMAPFK